MNRARLSILASMTSVALAVLGTAACSSDDSDTITPNPGSTTKDSGADTSTSTGNNDAGKDSASAADTSTGTDSSTSGDDSSTGDTDASDSSTTADANDGATPNFCASQTGLAYCNDFDEPSALGAGAGSAWDSLAGSLLGIDGGLPEIGLSTLKAVSAPSSMWASLPGNTVGHSVKVVKTVAPTGGFSQAIYDFDFYLDSIPTGLGGFITDFQLSDGTGQDQFGFRISVFGDGAGAISAANIEHNRPALNAGLNDIVSKITDANFTLGAWHHMRFAVSFAADTDGGNTVTFKAYLDKSTTALDLGDLNNPQPAPFAKAPFARIADGVVAAFGDNEKWGIYYDNVTLKLQ